MSACRTGKPWKDHASYKWGCVYLAALACCGFASVIRLGYDATAVLIAVQAKTMSTVIVGLIGILAALLARQSPQPSQK